MLIFYSHLKNSHQVGSLFFVRHPHNKGEGWRDRQCILLAHNLLDT